MNNMLLAIVVVTAVVAWRRFGFWLPPLIPGSVRLRQHGVFALGLGIMIATTAFAIGDAIGGRAQIARNPVRYATRLTGPAAHHHDLADPVAFWRQVFLEAGLGAAVGIGLIASSQLRATVSPRVD